MRRSRINTSDIRARSPAIDQAEAEFPGPRLIYKRIDRGALGVGAEALGAWLRAAELRGVAGVNVTHPCKQAVVPLLKERSPDAAALGAGMNGQGPRAAPAGF